MKLAKLLAAGKSIVNGRAEISYRANKQIYLPKFESAKNPFTAPKSGAPGGADGREDEAVPAAPERPTAPPDVLRRSSWMEKFNPLGSRSAAAEKSGTPEMTQAELSLDRVKVVQNDLTDAEVEVVPIKSRAPVPDLPPAKSSWELLGERLMKAGSF
ncbi:MAG: hypothetical protein KGR98_00090 [Verrucomicrobia bacterium]|nr:hypothetical protein [Verrucomicrobiota bacterium]MDE3099371.1 hypothetical protein [Verrucomicrobiota bacterium]